MKLKKTLVVVVVLILAVSLFACSKAYDETESKAVLDNAIKASALETDSTYVTIKDTITYQEKDSQGNAKVDKDGNPVMTERLAKQLVVNSTIADRKGYAKGTRMTYIADYSYDEFGKASSTNYWAGKEKDSDTSYLIKREGAKYYRQKIDNENIFEYAELAQYANANTLKAIFGLTTDKYDLVADAKGNYGRKEGHVEYFDIKVHEDYDATLAKLGVLTIRITNGKLTCIQANIIKDLVVIKDVTTKYQIDFLLAGANIELPTSKFLSDEAAKNAENFTDNATIVTIG